jgi:hypothetical protein
MLRRIFGPKREEVAGGWRRVHHQELHSLFDSPNIITVIKSRKMVLTGCELQMEEMRNVYRILVGKPEETRTLTRSRCRGRTILERILKKQDEE